MKRLSQKIYHLSLGSVQFIVLFLTVLLFGSNFLFTCYAENMETQVVCTRWDNLLLNLLGGFFLCIFFVFVASFVAKRGGTCKKLLLFVTFGWILALGAILILFGKTVPAADAMSVYGAADSLAKGDTSVIHPTDSYLSYYPQQVGLMAFLEILIRIWNLLGINVPAYHFIKGIYVLLLCVAVLYQYKSVHLLWENNTTDCLYLLLAGSNLPMIMYSSFVYGEIPSFTAFSVGLYFLLLFIKNARGTQSSKNASLLFPGSFSLLFLTLSVMLRKNSLILIIAVCLVLLLEWVRSHRYCFALLAVLCAMAAFLILPCVQKGYEIRSGSFLRSGVPAMSYVAMGMQESSRGQGWYNGYNINTYQACSMDTALTNNISRQSIRDSLSRFREDHGYAIDFYAKKFLSQWTDGTYASRQATLATFGGRRPLFQRIYEGDLSAFYIQYCNLYQNVIYLGVLLFCIAPYRRKRNRFRHTGLPLYIGFIGVIGGFLFHIIWEANSRYIFIYGLLLLPYAAWGLNLLSNTFSLGKFPRNNKCRRPHATDMPATEAQAGQASSREP